MKKFIILLALFIAFPLCASATEDGTIYSINGYGHFGSHTGYGVDLGLTIHTSPDSFFSPIIYFGMGVSGMDDLIMGDLKLLGGVSWHFNDFIYLDLSAGGQGFLYAGDNTPFGIGGAVLVDATVMLHIAEIIGIRAGCMTSFGTNGAMVSPHIGLASMFDFSWLFN